MIMEMSGQPINCIPPLFIPIRVKLTFWARQLGRTAILSAVTCGLLMLSGAVARAQVSCNPHDASELTTDQIAQKGVVDAINHQTAGAICWFRLAAEKGNPRAEYNLGLALKMGYTGHVDLSEAAKWLGAAADQGSTGAQRHLAEMYENGQLPANREQAEKLRSEASATETRLTAICGKKEIADSILTQFGEISKEETSADVMKELESLTNITYTEHNMKLVNASLVDGYSYTNFTCETMYKGDREFHNTEGKDEDSPLGSLPNLFPSAVPIVQEFDVLETETNYTITMNYIGSARFARFALSRPYSIIISKTGRSSSWACTYVHLGCP